MLKLALLFALIAVVAGVLGFFVDVAGGIAQFLFFVFLVLAAVTALPGLLRGKR